MLKYINTVALPFMAAIAIPSAIAEVSFPPPPVEPPPPVPPVEMAKVSPEKPKEMILSCIGCNSNESKTLSFFQDRGIKDKNSLATIMGNIRQESTFVPNICEGGARVPYGSCGGGYGLIQWTSSDRYYGLGKFAYKYGGSPSSLGTQLRYLVNEVQWRRIEPSMMAAGKTIPTYMGYCYSWLGWGIEGPRTRYAYDYAKRMILVPVES